MSDITHINGESFYVANQQLKIAGSRIELRKFGKGFFIGDRPKRSKHPVLGTEEKNTYDEQDIQDRRYRRAKRDLLDYVDCNTSGWISIAGHTEPPIFITLTFRENIQDMSFANREFSKFIQRFNLFVTGKKESYLKYVVVIEFQKRGAIHYHCLFFNLPYIKCIKTELAKLWRHGFTQIKATNRVKNLALYMTKYMSKSFNDPRLCGKKSYFVSRGLRRPIMVYYDELIDRIVSVLPQSAIEYEEADIPVAYMITLDLTRYNLKDYPKALEEILAFLERTGYDGPGKSIPKDITLPPAFDK